IMGSAYGQSITQWSDGSYPGANNTEDDLAMISANGAPLVGDDVGDTPAAGGACLRYVQDFGPERNIQLDRIGGSCTGHQLFHPHWHGGVLR
ncbi:MAG: hypothetical protein ACMUHY_02970, partial [Thermoplasmatota archaeon]